MKIIIYYHLTLLNNWETVLREQCTRIIFSGLYDIVHSIRCYAIDINGDQEEVCRNLLRNYGMKFYLEGVERSGTEWLTLKNIKDRVEDDDIVLYIHTKGVSRYNTDNYTLQTKEKELEIDHKFKFKVLNMYKNIEQWRDLMEYFLIRHHEKCLEIFNTNINIDTIGINVAGKPYHYSGNFWWARGRYLRSLPYDTPNDEPWLLQNKGNFVTMYQSPLLGTGHYFYEYPMQFFIDNNSRDTIQLYNSLNTLQDPNYIMDTPSEVSFSPPPKSTES